MSVRVLPADGAHLDVSWAGVRHEAPSVPDGRSKALKAVYAESLSADARVHLTNRARRRSSRVDQAQRIVDIVLASVGVVVTLPLMAVVALVVRSTSRGPALFRQTRLGQHGRSFTCLKFRTMVVNAEQLLDELLTADEHAGAYFAEVFKLPVDPRVTRVGAVLRKCSLDELPQLFNVLAGDMSIVGPRPLVPQELWRYGGYAPVLLQARPGLTGPWQIGGRSSLPYAERVQLDVDYVLNRRIWSDLKIAVMTLPRLLRSRGTAH